LTHHDPGAVGDTLTELEAVLQHVTGLLIRVGDTENVLDMADSHLQQRDERLQAGLSREQDADVAEVALELSKAEATYQSSLLASSRMLQMNLMQYLR
jgi:flagellar hook-associated protein 3 FlgL